MTAEDFLGPVAACRDCGALVRWALTRRGSAMPINAAPADGGNLILERRSAALVARVVGPMDLEDGDRYVSHFATCPHAAERRRRR